MGSEEQREALASGSEWCRLQNLHFSHHDRPYSSHFHFGATRRVRTMGQEWFVAALYAVGMQRTRRAAQRHHPRVRYPQVHL